MPSTAGDIYSDWFDKSNDWFAARIGEAKQPAVWSMPEATFSDAKKMVLSHQKLLGLSDWDIRVDVGDLSPDHFAILNYRDTERVAQIVLDRETAESGKSEFIGRCIAHELVHLVIHRYEEAANRAVAQLPEGLREVMADILDEELEVVVDTLAGLMSPGERFVTLGDEELTEQFPSWSPRGL